MIEPTTYSVLYGELAQNPYPEFLSLQEKVQTLGGGYEYLKKIGQESFPAADFKILWAKAEKSSDRLKFVQDDGARLATVGPCQVFAWLHIGTMPIIRTHLWVRSAASLLMAEAVIIPVVVQWLTVLPLASFSTKLASRSSFSKREIRLIA